MKYNVLWAVVEIIDAPDAGAALANLRNRLVTAGFQPYEGTDALLPEGYQAAFPSEPDHEPSAPLPGSVHTAQGLPVWGYTAQELPGWAYPLTALCGTCQEPVRMAGAEAPWEHAP